MPLAGATGSLTHSNFTGPRQAMEGPNLARANSAVAPPYSVGGIGRISGLSGSVPGKVGPGRTEECPPSSALPQVPSALHCRPSPAKQQTLNVSCRHPHDGNGGSGGQFAAGLQKVRAAHVNKGTSADAEANNRRPLVENTIRPRSPPRDAKPFPVEQRHSSPPYGTDKGFVDTPTGPKSRPLSSHGNLGPVPPVEDGLGRTNSLLHKTARGTATTGPGNTHPGSGTSRPLRTSLELSRPKNGGPQINDSTGRS